VPELTPEKASKVLRSFLPLLVLSFLPLYYSLASLVALFLNEAGRQAGGRASQQQAGSMPSTASFLFFRQLNMFFPLPVCLCEGIHGSEVRLSGPNFL
jgi:hypothetical protein